MAYVARVKRGKDKKVFARTALKTKRANLPSKYPMRGGIRL